MKLSQEEEKFLYEVYWEHHNEHFQKWVETMENDKIFLDTKMNEKVPNEKIQF